MKKVSVIICTRRRADSLQRTLRALDAVELPSGLAVECVVVDNDDRPGGSADTVQSTGLRHVRLRYVREPTGGKARALNTGMRHTDGDVIVFTDDDVIPDRGWLSGIVAPLAAGTCDAVCGGVKLAPDTERPWMEQIHRGWLASSERFERTNEALVGASMAISRGVLSRVPGFDPELGPGALGFGEDTLLFLQLRQAGFRVEKRLKAFCWHHPDVRRFTRQSWLRNAERMGRSEAYIAYHWWHIERRLIPLRERAMRWRLAAFRAVSGLAGGPPGEGCPPRELLMASRCSFWRQLRTEQKRPRKYTKCGLRKLDGPR